MPDPSDLVKASVRSRVLSEPALKRSRARQFWYLVIPLLLAIVVVVILTALGWMPY